MSGQEGVCSPCSWQQVLTGTDARVLCSRQETQRTSLAQNRPNLPISEAVHVIKIYFVITLSIRSETFVYNITDGISVMGSAMWWFMNSTTLLRVSDLTLGRGICCGSASSSSSTSQKNNGVIKNPNSKIIIYKNLKWRFDLQLTDHASHKRGKASDGDGDLKGFSVA